MEARKLRPHSALIGRREVVTPLQIVYRLRGFGLRASGSGFGLRASGSGFGLRASGSGFSLRASGSGFSLRASDVGVCLPRRPTADAFARPRHPVAPRLSPDPCRPSTVARPLSPLALSPDPCRPSPCRPTPVAPRPVAPARCATHSSIPCGGSPAPAPPRAYGDFPLRAGRAAMLGDPSITGLLAGDTPANGRGRLLPDAPPLLERPAHRH